MLVTFGALVIAAFPAMEMLKWMAMAVVMGATLAAVASIYPSLKAARLAPMEAMRIE